MNAPSADSRVLPIRDRYQFFIVQWTRCIFQWT